MVSRASLGNPWIFEHIQNYFEGRPIRKISSKEILSVILEHINLEVQEKGENIAIKEFRKHLAVYSKNMAGSSQFRSNINKIESKEELLKVIEEYFNNN